ncbi:MAG: hypothetical protein PVF17_04630 [Ignavibacteria bacterium]|jgi:hypothetical protein
MKNKILDELYELKDKMQYLYDCAKDSKGISIGDEDLYAGRSETGAG